MCLDNDNKQAAETAQGLVGDYKETSPVRMSLLEQLNNNREYHLREVNRLTANIEAIKKQPYRIQRLIEEIINHQ